MGTCYVVMLKLRVVVVFIVIGVSFGLSCVFVFCVGVNSQGIVLSNSQRICFWGVVGG